MPRKKNEEKVEETNAAETTETAAEETAAVEAQGAETEATGAEANQSNETSEEQPSVVESVVETVSSAVDAVKSAVGNMVGGSGGQTTRKKRGNRAERVGTVTSDKMMKTVVVRVDRLVKHPKYRKYVRRKKNFMAHDELGAAIGDKVRIVETRPLSARKRWRVVEIIQRAAK